MTMHIGCDFELTLPQAAWSDLVQVRRFEDRIAALGTKHEPTIIEGVKLHPDSLACEFAMTEPAESVGAFLMQFQRAREVAQAFMGTHLAGYDYVDTERLPLFGPNHCPVVYEAACTFGCDSDYQVLRNGKVMHRETVPTWVHERSVKECSGHLHIDLPDILCDDAERMGTYVGMYYDRTRVLHTWTHPTQRPWYRKPMVFRPKSYGFEYRSLGASLADNQPALELAVTQAFQLMDHLDREVRRGNWI